MSKSILVLVMVASFIGNTALASDLQMSAGVSQTAKTKPKPTPVVDDGRTLADYNIQKE